MLNIPKEELPPPPPPPPPPPDVVQQQRFVAPVVTTDSVETTMVTQDDLSAKPIQEAPAEEEIEVEEAKPRLLNRKLQRKSLPLLKNNQLTLEEMKPVLNSCRKT
jgi:hypothetical protein